RLAPRGRCHHGDGVRGARGGTAHRGRHPPARLPDRPGGGLPPRPDRGLRELHRGSALRLPESTDPGALTVMSIGTLAPPIDVPAAPAAASSSRRIWRKLARNPAALTGALILL